MTIETPQDYKPIHTPIYTQTDMDALVAALRQCQRDGQFHDDTREMIRAALDLVDKKGDTR